MKALLGSQCFALKGGPIYGVEQVLTTGNYAGVLVPTAMDNSLGIFTLTAPTTGLGSGTVALFRNGIFYPGTIQGIADPDSAILIGVVDSSFSNTFTSVTDQGTGTTEDFIITFNASGSINAKIRPNPNVFSTATARLVGSAAITYATVGAAPGFDSSIANSNGHVDYAVDGFKQSEVIQ